MNDILVNVYLFLVIALAFALLVRALVGTWRLRNMPAPVVAAPPPPEEPSGPPTLGDAIEGVNDAVLALETALAVFDEYTVGHAHCVTLRFGVRLVHVHSPDCPASKLTAGGPNIRSENGVHSHPIPAAGRRRPPTPSDLN